MKIDKYYHLYSRRLDVVFEEIPRPAGRGRWITGGDSIYCSECRKSRWSRVPFENLVKDFNYCPNCGAKMEEVV